MSPLVVVSVDTEEEGLWTDSYPVAGNTCRNVGELPRLAAIFARLGVRPTYLVSWAVATDARARAVLRELAAGGAAEIGAHLHPWCTPPLQPDGTSRRATFPHRLRPQVQRTKLAALRASITDAFGAAPTSYRAGRWGFDATTVPLLEELGFTVDTSVKPLWWDPTAGGPSFVRAPQVPYRLARDDAQRPGRSGVVEVPVSVAIVGRRGPTWERATRLLPPAPGLRRFVHRLGWRGLLPELHTLEELCGLADELVARGTPVLNLTFHSSVLLAGATPFARDVRQVDAFVARVEGVLEHVAERHRAVPATLSEVPALLGAAVLQA